MPGIQIIGAGGQSLEARGIFGTSQEPSVNSRGDNWKRFIWCLSQDGKWLAITCTIHRGWVETVRIEEITTQEFTKYGVFPSEIWWQLRDIARELAYRRQVYYNDSFALLERIELEGFMLAEHS